MHWCWAEPCSCDVLGTALHRPAHQHQGLFLFNLHWQKQLHLAKHPLRKSVELGSPTKMPCRVAGGKHCIEAKSFMGWGEWIKQEKSSYFCMLERTKPGGEWAQPRSPGLHREQSSQLLWLPFVRINRITLEGNVVKRSRSDTWVSLLSNLLLWPCTHQDVQCIPQHKVPMTWVYTAVNPP